MGLLGLSILIATVTYLCYRHPPSTWSSFLRLQSQPANALLDKAKNSSSQAEANIPKNDAITSPISKSEDNAPAPPPAIAVEAPADAQAKADAERTSMPPPSASTISLAKAETDKKEMPPPSFKKPTISASQLRSSQPMAPPPVPTFSMPSSTPDSSDDDDEPIAPSFPAINSAQRASGGLSAPRQPAPPRAQPPLRSAGLMSPPARGPLPNRSPMSSSSGGFSLAPPPTHNSIPSKPRKKVLLTPGHSPLDWARLSSSPGANLRGLPADTPYLRVPPSLLKQFTGRKGKDAWTVLGGKVYNISPYAPYHPGGEPELLKAAGRDGTKLFGEVHPWVNWEGMLEGCLVGIAVEEGDVQSGGLEEMD